MLACTLAISALALIGFMLFARRLGVSISKLTTTMGTLAAGDLSVSVDGQKRSDEIGAMAHAVDVFKQASVEKVRLESEAEASRRAEALRREAQAEADRAKARELEGFVADIEAGFVRLAAGRPDGAHGKTRGARVRADPRSVQRLAGEAGAHDGCGGGLDRHDPHGPCRDQRRLQRSRPAHRAAGGEPRGDGRRARRGDARRQRDRRERRPGAGQRQSAQRNAERGGEIVGRAIDAMQTIEQSSQKIGNIIG